MATDPTCENSIALSGACMSCGGRNDAVAESSLAAETVHTSMAPRASEVIGPRPVPSRTVTACGVAESAPHDELESLKVQVVAVTPSSYSGLRPSYFPPVQQGVESLEMEEPVERESTSDTSLDTAARDNRPCSSPVSAVSGRSLIHEDDVPRCFREKRRSTMLLIVLLLLVTVTGVAVVIARLYTESTQEKEPTKDTAVTSECQGSKCCNGDIPVTVLSYDDSTKGYVWARKLGESNCSGKAISLGGTCQVHCPGQVPTYYSCVEDKNGNYSWVTHEAKKFEELKCTDDLYTCQLPEISSVGHFPLEMCFEGRCIMGKSVPISCKPGFTAGLLSLESDRFYSGENVCITCGYRGYWLPRGLEPKCQNSSQKGGTPPSPATLPKTTVQSLCREAPFPQRDRADSSSQINYICTFNRGLPVCQFQCSHGYESANGRKGWSWVCYKNSKTGQYMWNPSGGRLLVCRSRYCRQHPLAHVSGTGGWTSTVTRESKKYSFGDEVSITCDGTWLNHPHDSTVTGQCMANGQWSFSNLTCSPHACKVPDIDGLLLSEEVANRPDAEVPSGTTIQYSCRSGYIMENGEQSASVACFNSRWSGRLSLCFAEEKCSHATIQLEHLGHASSCSRRHVATAWGTQYLEETCTATCTAGYSGNGSLPHWSLICRLQESGEYLWAHNHTSCRPSSCHNRTLPVGNYELSVSCPTTSGKCRDPSSGLVPSGTEVVYKCPGVQLNTTLARDTTTCLYGSWTKFAMPKCPCKECNLTKWIAEKKWNTAGYIRSTHVEYLQPGETVKISCAPKHGDLQRRKQCHEELLLSGMNSPQPTKQWRETRIVYTCVCNPSGQIQPISVRRSLRCFDLPTKLERLKYNNGYCYSESNRTTATY